MKRNFGNLIIIGCVFLTALVWLIFPPTYDGRENFARAYAGEVIGSINIVLMACALFLSARPKWAEKYFGGLDKMYATHRRVATAAFLLIFVHVLTVPITLLRYSQSLALGADEWLVVAARDRGGPGVGTDDPFEATTIQLRIKGADLQALHAGRLTPDEARKRVEVKEY